MVKMNNNTSIPSIMTRRHGHGWFVYFHLLSLSFRTGEMVFLFSQDQRGGENPQQPIAGGGWAEARPTAGWGRPSLLPGLLND